MEMNVGRTHRRRRAKLVVCALGLSTVVLGLAACGGNDDGKSTTTSTSAADAVPAEIVGTYERTVKEGEPGNPPPGVWKIALGPKGEFFNVPPGETGFFNGLVLVTGSEMKIPAAPEAGCTSNGTYTVATKGPRPGGTLKFTLVDDKFCEARASVLAGGAWTRTD
jgi:hypothetical protein